MEEENLGLPQEGSSEIKYLHLTGCTGVPTEVDNENVGINSWGYTQKTVTPEAPAHPCLLWHYSQ
jgi:hypothetical protein